jgi:hypothetical protein
MRRRVWKSDYVNIRKPNERDKHGVHLTSIQLRCKYRDKVGVRCGFNLVFKYGMDKKSFEEGGNLSNA